MGMTKSMRVVIRISTQKNRTMTQMMTLKSQFLVPDEGGGLLLVQSGGGETDTPTKIIISIT